MALLYCLSYNGKLTLILVYPHTFYKVKGVGIYFLHFCKIFARLMGADPTTSPVTGECSTVELQPQSFIIHKIKQFQSYFCAGGKSRTSDQGL